MDDQIKRAVSKAISTLRRDDGTLFDCAIEEGFDYDSRKLHEVCINHRLATYLEQEILPIVNGTEQKYFVDIEFNKEGINKKKILRYNGQELVVRPDIIIHNRFTIGNPVTKRKTCSLWSARKLARRERRYVRIGRRC
jgi:hypothetical protein